MKVLMVRSTRNLVNKGYIGCGWNRVNFSEFETANSIINHLKEIGSDPGRRRKNLIRFFNLKEGDLVIVPLSKRIALGKVVGEKRYSTTLDGEFFNLIKVEFLETATGPLLIPRANLKDALERRLKIRSFCADLDEFRGEITGLFNHLPTDDLVTFSNTRLIEKQTELDQQFKKRLLEAIQKGTTYLKAGGIGIEELIKELLIIDGFDVEIPPKNRQSGTADVDLVAFRENPYGDNSLLIQAKHHNKETGRNGLNQLRAYNDLETIDYQKCLISTGIITDELREDAKRDNIICIDGNEFVNWIFRSLKDLSDITKIRLNIIEAPVYFE